MTSWECYENKWFYMKHMGKYLGGEICTNQNQIKYVINQSKALEGQQAKLQIHI